MRPHRSSPTRAAAGALAGALALLLTACGGSSPDEPDAPGSPEAAAGASPSPAPTASPAPRPPDDGCYRLTHAEALAPTTAAAPVPCGRRHTAQTFAVGRVDAVVAGHLLAVDSARVQAQVARACPERLAGFLGGSEEQRRLSMLRSAWFTPTLEESDAGADWFRCDAIALAADGELATLDGPLAGALDDPQRRAAYGMCATAEPGTPGFRRVVCSAEHAWRAVATVPLPGGDDERGEGGDYPGVDAVRGAGEVPCEDAGRDAAADPFDFRWGYEWPTRAQWRAGQRWGLCWVPD